MNATGVECFGGPLDGDVFDQFPNPQLGDKVASSSGYYEYSMGRRGLWCGWGYFWRQA